MARKIIQAIPGSVYIDLQNPTDLAKLNDPQYFFEMNRGRLICLDEIQRLPGLFPVIRSLVDQWGGNGHFLFLGSASRDLLRQSSESLAGRIFTGNHAPVMANAGSCKWSDCELYEFG